MHYYYYSLFYYRYYYFMPDGLKTYYYEMFGLWCSHQRPVCRLL